VEKITYSKFDYLYLASVYIDSMSRVEIKKGSNWFFLELITSTELVMRIADDD
jgi:hypothetical protein